MERGGIKRVEEGEKEKIRRRRRREGVTWRWRESRKKGGREEERGEGEGLSSLEHWSRGVCQKDWNLRGNWNSRGFSGSLAL